jgi:hypothetical protein
MEVHEAASIALRLADAPGGGDDRGMIRGIVAGSWRDAATPEVGQSGGDRVATAPPRQTRLTAKPREKNTPQGLNAGLGASAPSCGSAGAATSAAGLPNQCTHWP